MQMKQVKINVFAVWQSKDLNFRTSSYEHKSFTTDLLPVYEKGPSQYQYTVICIPIQCNTQVYCVLK